MVKNKKTAKVVLSMALALILIVSTFVCLTLIPANAAWAVTKVADIYSDDFESYEEGSDLHGQNSWISQSRKVDGVIYSHVVTNGTLRLEDKNQNGWRCFRAVRPEEYINQRVSFDITGLKGVGTSNNALVTAQLRYAGDDAADGDGNPGPTNTYMAVVTNTQLDIRYMSGINSGTQWSINPTTVSGALQTYTQITDDHVYTLEFVAVAKPDVAGTTVLIATLYDKTDNNEVVATVTGEDSHSDLQAAGMAAAAYKSNNKNEYIYIDNFDYDEVSIAEVTDPEPDPEEPDPEVPAEKEQPFYYEDNFDSYEEGADINGQNDWYSVHRTTKASHTVTGGALKAEDTKYSDTYTPNGSFTSITKRPEDEATINQKVTVDILNVDDLTNTAHAAIHLRVRPIIAFYDSAQTNIKGIDTYLLAVSAGSLQFKYTTTGSEKAITDVNAVAWNYTAGHKYRVEFSAEGVYPTKLKARIFDIDAGNRLVVETSAEDSTAALQCAGTSALSHVSDGTFTKTYTLYDNFKYEQIDNVHYYDSFNTSALDSEWRLASKANVVQKSGYIAVNTTGAVAGNRYVSDSTVMRPEKALNQIVEVEWSRGDTSTSNLNTGVTAILRSQNGDGAFSTSYQANLEVGRGSVNANHGWLTITNGSGQILNTEVQYLTGTSTWRLEFIATSTSSTETQLTVNIYRKETYGGIQVWRCRYSTTVTDSTAALQKPGAAGFSMYDLNCGTINVYSFSHHSPVNSYDDFELENDSTVKNLYQKVSDETANGGALVEPITDKNVAAYSNVTTYLDYNAPFVAFAVNAKKAKDYNMKLNYRMNWDNPTDGVDPYATMVVNGTAYKFPYNASYGSFTETTEIQVTLNAGINIIYLLAPTAELAGATIDYDRLYMEEGIEISNVELVAAGDANSDYTVDIRDIVRFKKYLQVNTTVVNSDAVEALISKADDTEWTNDDGSAFYQYLLIMGTDNETYNSLSWFTFKAATFLNNTLYKLMNNQALNVAYMGGSVTDGYGASDASLYSWRARTTAWLKERFPEAADGIIENEAAVGGTGTDFGMYRAVNDLYLEDANQKPDLLFLEFAINDAYDGVGYDGAKLGLESIINTVYDYSPETDIVIVLTTDASRGASEYDTLTGHLEIAEKYRLPYIKVGQKLWNFLAEEAAANGTSLETERQKYFPALSTGGYDSVHPNDEGYAKYAEYVTEELDALFTAIEDDVPNASVNAWRPSETATTLPYKPAAWKAENLNGTEGWYIINSDTFTTGADNVGASFSFKFTGTELKAWAWGYVYAPTVSVSIDGNEATEFELYRHSGNHKVFTFAENLTNEEHTVTITYTKAPVVPDGETDPEPHPQKVKFREFFTSGAEDANFSK